MLSHYHSHKYENRKEFNLPQFFANLLKLFTLHTELSFKSKLMALNMYIIITAPLPSVLLKPIEQ